VHLFKLANVVKLHPFFIAELSRLEQHGAVLFFRDEHDTKEYQQVSLSRMMQ
jgi:hypothetical protein